MKEVVSSVMEEMSEGHALSPQIQDYGIGQAVEECRQLGVLDWLEVREMVGEEVSYLPPE